MKYPMRRIGAALLLGGILTVGAIDPVRHAKAATVRSAVFAPIHVRAGEKLLMTLINTENQPIAVRFQVLKGTDLSPLASSNPFNVAPGGGAWFVPDMDSDQSFLAPAIEVLAARDASTGRSTGLRASVQLLDASGQTLAVYGNYDGALQ